MFDPSVGDVRDFFCATWAKTQAASLLTPLETIASDWIALHPEYHDDFADAREAKARDYAAASGRTNPFLHLSLHLAIAEQIGIDQPHGIRAAHAALLAKTGSAHDAAHALLDCLAEAIWRAQRDGAPIDEDAYRRAILSRAGIAS